MITSEHRLTYEYMYYDLLSNRLEVVLIPSKHPDIAADGGCIRVPITRNPDWYQQFCSRYVVSSRRKKKRTIIRRQSVLNILLRLSKGKSSCSKYSNNLKDIALGIKESNRISDYEMEYFIKYGEYPEPFSDRIS